MRKNLSFILSVCLLLAAFALLLAAPGEAAENVRQGLSLCAGVIIPSLLPFFVLSGLVSGLGLPLLLGRAAGPLMRGLFGVSGASSAPFLLGLTGGYPVGAASVADLVKTGTLSAEEGERLLPFCNNTGPAFIIGAVGSGVFASTGYGVLLYLSHIAAAVAVGVLFSRSRQSGPPAPPLPAFQAKNLAQVLSASVKNAVGATLNICGFVLFFTVVRGMLERAGLFTALAGALAEGLGLELHFCRALLTGLLELGGGVGAMKGLASTPLNLALASFLLGFGSLSVHCQTLAAVEGTEMKCARHFAGRILHGLLSALFTFVLFTLLRS